jgi:hypothetical protein
LPNTSYVDPELLKLMLVVTYSAARETSDPDMNDMPAGFQNTVPASCVEAAIPEYATPNPLAVTS